MKISELQGKTPDQLATLVKELSKEAFNLRFQKTTGELEKTHRGREVRKTIARIKTLQNQAKKTETAPAKAAKKTKTKKKAA